MWVVCECNGTKKINKQPMKTILYNIIFLIYVFSAFAILCFAAFAPFVMGIDNDYPMWTNWILYPLAILIMVSHRKIDKYFEILIMSNKFTETINLLNEQILISHYMIECHKRELNNLAYATADSQRIFFLKLEISKYNQKIDEYNQAIKLLR